MLVSIVSSEPHEKVKPEFSSVLRLSGHEIHQVIKAVGGGGVIFFDIADCPALHSMVK